MSHFYATIPTSARKTVPTARGHKSTGVETIGASWKGGILTSLWHDADTDRDSGVGQHRETDPGQYRAWPSDGKFVRR